jgi:hypothetical protein
MPYNIKSVNILGSYTPSMPIKQYWHDCCPIVEANTMEMGQLEHTCDRKERQQESIPYVTIRAIYIVMFNLLTFLQIRGGLSDEHKARHCSEYGDTPYILFSL